MSKLINEVQAIIADPSLKRAEKLARLEIIELSGRAGKKEAETIAFQYKNKFNSYLEGKYVNPRGRYGGVLRGIGKSPRGLKLSPRKEDRYEKYLSKFRFVFFSEAETIARGLGIDLNKPCSSKKATKLHLALSAKNTEREQFEAASRLSWKKYFRKEASISEVQENKAGYATKSIYCLVNGWYVTVGQDESEDWEAYSKGWHKAHGAKRTIDSRWVRFSKGGHDSKSIEVEAFAGNYLFKAIATFFELKPVKVSKGFKPVQLNDIFSLVQLHKVGNVAIYERTIAETHYDFCAFDGTNTYHAKTVAEAIDGLRNKLDKFAQAEAKRLEAENKVLTAAYCHNQYGFCYDGMCEFADLNGLDIEGQYTIKALRAAVVGKRAENCRRFKKELAVIGIALNCK